MRVYLSGEIHTDWRDEIIANSRDLDITFEGPVTDHELSDDCGVMIMGKEADKFWHDNKGAKGCLIQVEGGPDMTLSHLNQLSESLVSSLHPDCQVILGARASDEMVGRLRLVAVVSGLS